MRIVLYIGAILLGLFLFLGIVGIISTIILAYVYKQKDIAFPKIIYMPTLTIVVFFYGIIIIVLYLKLQIERLWIKLVTRFA